MERKAKEEAERNAPLRAELEKVRKENEELKTRRQKKDEVQRGAILEQRRILEDEQKEKERLLREIAELKARLALPAGLPTGHPQGKGKKKGKGKKGGGTQHW